MSGLETALLGAVANTVSKEVSQWLDNRGPDFSEDDWMKVGLPVGRQIRAEYEQYQVGETPKEDEVREQVDHAGKIYRELSYIGENRGFDTEVVDIYSDLADLCADWVADPSLHVDVATSDHSDRFKQLHERYKELVL